MEGMCEMWDGYNGYHDQTSPEEKLTARLTPVEKFKKSKKSKRNFNKQPDRAFQYLTKHWSMIEKYISKYPFFKKHSVVVDLLESTFGNFDIAPVNHFLVKKGIFSKSFYKGLYITLVFTVSYLVYKIVLLGFLPVHALIFVLFLLGTLVLLF